jgi:hypothetical protein
MKVATCLRFLLLGCATWIVGTAYADSPKSASEHKSLKRSANKVTDHRQDGKLPVEKQSHSHVSSMNGPRSSASMTGVHSRGQRFSSGKISDFYPSSLEKFNPATSNGLPPRKTIHTGISVRRTNLMQATSPLLNDVWHRGASPAVISGSANSKVSNTAAINGTGMHRRP